MTEPLLQTNLGMSKDLTDDEFKLFSQLFFDLSGIRLRENKKHLLIGRLSGRLRHYGLTSFKDYFELVTADGNEIEKQCLLDLLTTNETSFFREPIHFELLKNHILSKYPQNYPLKVWSAAASSGEEAYSVAMVLTDVLGCSGPWSIVGTDINLQVLQRARQAKYPITAASLIPQSYLKKYCLKGFDREAGNLLIAGALRSKVNFIHFNLNNENWHDLALFDVIFLRNIMIYFDIDTKRTMVKKMARQLKLGGYLIIGLSETIHDYEHHFEKVGPSFIALSDEVKGHK